MLSISGGAKKVRDASDVPEGKIVVEDLTKKLLPVIGLPKFACIIHHFMSEEECNELIELAEKEGFDAATIQGADGQAVVDKKIRKCGRVITDKPLLAEDWRRRTIEAMADMPNLRKKFLTAPWMTARTDIPFECVGFNERLRFLRYNKGDEFRPHQDIPFTRGPEAGDKAGETSFLTFIIFLNEPKKGGALRFVGDDDRFYDFEPTPGSVAIFDHDIKHQGCKITSGKKFAVRSDVMYKGG